MSPVTVNSGLGDSRSNSASSGSSEAKNGKNFLSVFSSPKPGCEPPQEAVPKKCISSPKRVVKKAKKKAHFQMDVEEEIVSPINENGEINGGDLINATNADQSDRVLETSF